MFADMGSKPLELGEGVTMLVGKMFEGLYELDNQVNMIMNPTGKIDYPAQTCKDIKMSWPDSKNGDYWIDPNGGAIGDKMKVWCNMTGDGATCVYPLDRTRRSPQAFHKLEKNNNFFGGLENGFSIEYPDAIQLRFLREHSDRATQTFTYYCKNSVAWKNPVGDKSKALVLEGANKFQFKTAKWKNVIDGCQTNSGNGKAIFELNTSKVQRLPLVDFMPRDYGQPDQEFGFEVGPVCFL
ncbi:hypothetical protein FSP39_004747 [Pinctada imbricata]|uniref:Fibrillar collagen NC1 domain-containing protein n=1 Tax=Pinctada imbricata TaxID=66713 RepID=A0AA88XL28_PINIB|nr:hypothetical protein FSP39_004747 [Pinctada imbricata]